VGNPFAAAARQMPTRATDRGAGFEGASSGRLYADWEAWTLSPDFEVRYQFRLLRARARDLARNNPWATGFVDEVANNVIGPYGILLQAKVKTAAGELVKKTNLEIERGWKEWGNPETASADGHDSFIEIERLLMQTIVIDGEVILRRLSGFNNPFGYTLQFIDPDLLDESYNVAAGSGQNLIKMGVEVDRWNRPVAYWFWTNYAEDHTGQARKRERVPADEVLHLFVRYRANQTRGITWFAPVITKLRHLDGYEFNELVSSRAAAAKMGIILNKSPDAIAGFDWEDHEPKVEDNLPGVTKELLPGQEFVEYDPKHPSTAYEMFMSTALRAVARGLKVSYLTMTGDLRAANYSSMRAGLLPERDRWRGLQVWLAMHCHRVVYRDWVDLAALKGAITVDSRLGADYYSVEWKGRGWKWVDPSAEIEAAERELKLGVNSRQRIAAEQGRDYEEVVDELQYEEEYADEAGVDVSGSTPTSTPSTNDGSAGGSEDTGGSVPTNDTTDETDARAPRRAARQRRIAAVR
jgi:lambda family phage portal protein